MNSAKSKNGAEGAHTWTASLHSHSIVPGGFDVMS